MSSAAAKLVFIILNVTFINRMPYGKYSLARDSGFMIQDSRLKNKSRKMYFKKKVPDFRISKYVPTIVLL